MQKFTDRDQGVVDELGNLLDRTSKREEKISHITSQLEVELGYLTSFLDNLASRRPKGKISFYFYEVKYCVKILLLNLHCNIKN